MQRALLRFASTACAFLVCLDGASADEEVQAPLDGDAIVETLHRADRFVDPVSEQGQQARGLYFNGPMMRRLGARGIIRMLQAAELDAAVLDLKDGQGRVTYDTDIELLEPQIRRFIHPAELVRALHDAGMYAIGRIVCFSDPVLPRRHPDRAVMDGRPRRKGQVWGQDWTRKNTWLDPYNSRNHDLVLALAKEAQAMGFDEIQLDYVRFPVDDATQYAVFPAQTDVPRRYVILGMLRRIDEALTIPIGTDVFGLTAFRTGDPSGLGQSLEHWARHVEVFTPMLYVNGMSQWLSGAKEQRAGTLLNAAMKNLRRRLGYGPVLRPFMQAFSEGADYFDARFIAEQVLGARAGGADGFLFWHPASNYGTVRAGMLGPARGATPFPLDARATWRRQTWSDLMSAQARAEKLPKQD